MAKLKIYKEDAEYFKDVVFLIEANNHEQHFLWRQYHEQVNWNQEIRGYHLEIGTLDKRPVCINLSYVKLNSKRVLFYYGCSQVVDHKMIEDWLMAFTKDIKWDGGDRWAHCDSMNFHHCLAAIKET